MPHAGKLNVLLIGCPEPVIRAVQAGGHATLASAVSDVGIRQASHTVLDVVIVDLNETASDPRSLADRLQAISGFRRPMILGLTDTTSDALDAQCKEAGIDLLLIKPVPPTQVTQFLGRLNSVVQDFESFDPMI